MNRCSVLSAVIALVCAPAAFAGGYVAPIIETAPIVAAAPVVSTINDWTGPYVGANIGWGKGELDGNSTKKGEHQLSKPDGFSGALRAGYDWQVGQGVFGLGAEYGFGKFKDNVTNLEPGKLEIKNPAMLFARAGYAFNSKVLAYALFGYTWADVREPVDATPPTVRYMDRSVNGVTVGAGTEYRFHKNWSAFAEYSYTDFGKMVLTITDQYPDQSNTKADIDLHQITLGVNYRF